MDKLNSYPQKNSITLLDRDLKELRRVPWKTCVLCGAEQKKVELKFKTGSVTPVVGETLTGGTSGHTGIVAELETLLSGSWAGGDATGYVHLTSYTGADAEDNFCFSDGETVTGSSGATLVADGKGSIKNYSIVYPVTDMNYYRGEWYCRPHSLAKWGGLRAKDEVKIFIQDEGGDNLP